MIKSIKVKVR